MQLNIRRMFQLCVLLGAAITTGNSYGAMTNKMLLDVLLENGAINQAQYDKLLLGSKEEEKKDVNEVTVSLDKGALKFKTKDGDFKAQVGGRVQVDGAWYSDDEGILGDGTEIRRARLFMAGTVWNDWHFKGQYDFAGDSASVNDAYIKYTGLEDIIGFPLDTTIGHFKEAFALEQLTSSKYITFMERALPVEAFAPGRNLGFAVNSHGKLFDGGWTAAAGIFGEGIDGGPGGGIDEVYGGVGRLTIAPIAEKTRVLHIGGAIEYRELKESLGAGTSFRVRSRPESHIADARLVSATLFTSPAAGTKFEGNVTRYGAELAGVWGPFSAQGEYIRADYDIDTVGGIDADFDGWYAYTSWFVTGESRNYSAKTGAFGRVQPNGIVGKGGIGAFEVASRFSYLDLNDGLVARGGRDGGREKNWTFGLNWYATPSIRFMANYIFVDVDGGTNINPEIFQVRGQVDF